MTHRQHLTLGRYYQQRAHVLAETAFHGAQWDTITRGWGDHVAMVDKWVMHMIAVFALYWR